VRAQSMNDITVRKRKVTGYTKRQNQTKTHLRHVIIFTAIVTTLLVILYLVGSHQLRYDNGAVWVHNRGSQTVKTVHQSEVDVKEVLSAIYPKKVVKKPVYKDTTMADRELKYKPIIAKYFPEETEIMLAIAKAESSLNSNAVNYNCYYDSKGLVYPTRPKGGISKSCKQGHEKEAWSYDSCALQVNSIHKSDVSTVDKCMQLARKIYDSQGKKAWVAYNTGSYKKYLTINN